MEDKKSLRDLLAVKKEVEDDEGGVKALLGEQEKALDSLLERTKDKIDVGNWLKKAHKHELAGDYRKALESYLKFMEGKLDELKLNPHSTLQSYLALVGFYLKIAGCYEKVTHTTAGGKAKDMENAGKYYLTAAGMYIELGKYEEAYKYYEDAARCYAEVESYSKAAGAYMDAAFMQHNLGKKGTSCTSFNKAAEFYEKAEEYANASKAYMKSVEISLDIKDVYGAITGYKRIAECYDKMEKPRDAIQYYIKSAELSSTVERYSDVAQRYEGVAKAYELLEDGKNAIFYYMRASDLNTGNDDLAASYNLDNAARCYAKMQDYDKAIDYYKRSTKIRIGLKRFVEAAMSSLETARLYEKKNDLENAASYYFQYADFKSNVNQKDDAKEGYTNAARIYDNIAAQRLAEKDQEKAIDDYLEATRCYDKLHEDKTAADLYLKMGEMEVGRNYDNAVKFYMEAASRYMAINDSFHAATCYSFAKDHLSAAKNYSDYALGQSKKNQFFYAGDGYRKAAEEYFKLKKFTGMREAYGKAIHNYSQYLENAEYIKTTDEDMNVGNANKKIGECCIESEDAPKAKQYLAAALSYVTEKKNEKDKSVIQALLNMVDADQSLKIGDYEKTSSLLKEAYSLLDKSIKDAWPHEYLEFLEQKKDEVKEIIDKIDIRPVVDLVIDQPGPATAGKIMIHGRITNNSKHPINNIYFLINLPQEFRVSKEPENIDELGPAQSSDVSIEADIDAPGKYNFSPMEIVYKDKDGNKYMKSSSEILVEVENKKA